MKNIVFLEWIGDYSGREGLAATNNRLANKKEDKKLVVKIHN